MGEPKTRWSTWCFADVLMSPGNSLTYVKSSDLMKPPEEFFHRHLQRIPPTPGGRKSGSHWADSNLSEAVECRGAFRRHGGRWHWGRGRRRRRRRTFHRPRRSRPMCGHSALWALFRSGTPDSSDWPGESGPDVLMFVQNPITILALQKWSWPLGRNLPRFWFFQLPPLPFVVEMGWNAFSHETSPNPIATTKMLEHARTVKIKFEEENVHHVHIHASPRLCLRFRWMLKSVLQIWAGGNLRSNYILTLIKENHENNAVV